MGFGMMFENKDLLLLCMAIVLTLPMAISDAKQFSVHVGWIFAMIALVLVFDLVWPDDTWFLRWFFAATVMLAGVLGYYLSKGRMGFGDILYIAALATVLPVWNWLIVVGVATIAGMVYFSYIGMFKKQAVHSIPLPFVTVLFASLFAFGVIQCVGP